MERIWFSSKKVRVGVSVGFRVRVRARLGVRFVVRLGAFSDPSNSLDSLNLLTPLLLQGEDEDLEALIKQGLTREEMKRLKPKDHVESRDCEGRFARGNIIKVEADSVKVHYIGFKKDFDETVLFSECYRICKPGNPKARPWPNIF